METDNENGKTRQRRSTPEERAEILETFRSSGLTRRAFSQTHGIALNTLNKWLTIAGKGGRAPKPVLFRELKVQQVPMSATMAWAIEIVSPDGLVVRCREALPLQDVSWLLRGR
jgi:transposase-like protein